MSRVRQHKHSAWPARQKRISKPIALAVSALVAILVSAPSCSSGDDIFRALRPLADDVDGLRASKWTPRTPLPIRQEPTAEEIVAGAERLATPLERVPFERQKEVTKYACDALDLQDVQDLEDLTGYLASLPENAQSYRLQVEELVDNLNEAEHRSEQAVVLGRALLCEWASLD